MWAAIKTDLTDLLNGGNNTNSLDHDCVNSLDDDVLKDASAPSNIVNPYLRDCKESPEEEAEHLSGLKETFTEPLLSGFEEVSFNTNETSYKSYGSDDEETFEQLLVKQFLESFDIESHADEIVKLLHPFDCGETFDREETGEEKLPQAAELNPLQVHYQQLVQQSQISHEQFWTRYFFRCNPDLISQRREHKRYLAEEHRTQQLDIGTINQTAFRIGKSLFQNVSGAVGTVSESIGEATREFAYQSSGRPPFVIAAIDDDDDEYFENEEEVVSEEEVSLTWEEGSVADDSIHDEVAFVGGTSTPLVLESLDVKRLRRTLMHVESERNNMMQMVEERNEEIAKLRCMLDKNSETAVIDKTVNELRDELKCLRTYAALKNAKAAVAELQSKIDLVKKASMHFSLESLIRKEYSKHKDLQSKLDEYMTKVEELQSKKQAADSSIARLLLKE